MMPILHVMPAAADCPKSVLPPFSICLENTANEALHGNCKSIYFSCPATKIC